MEGGCSVSERRRSFLEALLRLLCACVCTWISAFSHHTLHTGAGSCAACWRAGFSSLCKVEPACLLTVRIQGAVSLCRHLDPCLQPPHPARPVLNHHAIPAQRQVDSGSHGCAPSPDSELPWMLPCCACTCG